MNGAAQDLTGGYCPVMARALVGQTRRIYNWANN
jgi:hypothetical protein